MLNNPKNAPPPAKPKRYAFTGVRLGDLTVPLEKRAASETKAAGRRITPSAILKRALRAYLSGENVQHFDTSGMIEELAGLRSDLARVGGNLNQLAHTFNIYGQVDDKELRQNHEALQGEFRQIMAMLKEIRDELHKRR